jgi:hypothetical protein
MTGSILRLTVAILAFGFGLTIDRLFISRTVDEKPPAQVTCDPNRIEVRTVFIPPPAAPPVHIVDFDIDFVPPSGLYFIAGKIPKDFEGFSSLELWWDRDTEDSTVNGMATISAWTNAAHTTQNQQRNVVSLVTKRRVLVVTESASGNDFGYRFDGEFVQANNLAALAAAGKPLIRGTLTKTKNGRKITERVVSLLLDNEHSGC